MKLLHTKVEFYPEVKSETKNVTAVSTTLYVVRPVGL